jgi:uracil phosphoribosyltransferase
MDEQRFHKEIEHRYGKNCHILDDPYMLSLLAELCMPQTRQPRLNHLLRVLYEGLLRVVINNEFPRKMRTVTTRMGAEYRAELIDPSTEVVTVDIARAGIMPSMVCFEVLSSILDPKLVRQDHIIMQRTTDAHGSVTGATISGTKVGGTIASKIVLFPDPMGATGSSLCEVLKFYRENAAGKPKKVITLNLIITPEFVRKVFREEPDVIIYAYRVDRGLSPPDVLAKVPGEEWDRERGLNDHDYIIPGAGGLGEVLNNAEV